MPHSQRPVTLDLTLERIERFNVANGGGVIVRKHARGYSLFREDNGAPVARLRPLKASNLMQVLRWSWRDRWEPVGDFGGLHLPLDEALDYVAEDPIGCFWR